MTDPAGVVRWTCPPMLPDSARSRRCWPSKCLSGWRECAEARLGRWREPSSCLVAAVGTVALAVSPSPSRQGCRAASAGPTEGRSASGRPSSWSGLSRMSECLLCRSPPVRVRCPVPGVRCRVSGVRASVSVRPVSASACPHRRGSWSASVRRGSPTVGRATWAWSPAASASGPLVYPSPDGAVGVGGGRLGQRRRRP